MKKLSYSDINKQQLVDLRSQLDFQAGYVKNSINLSPSNFEKYAADLLSFDHRIVFITDDTIEESIGELEEIVDNISNYINVVGYINIKEFPDANLLQVNTISAKDFLKNKDDYILLDARHPEEITRVAPKRNLLNIPLGKLTDSLKHIDKNKEVYTLCGSGNRGTTAASYLNKEGYHSTVIEGGMKAIEEVLNSQ